MSEIPVNKKIFLAKDDVLSTAACHIKVFNKPERQEYQLRVSDCNMAIKLWGQTTTVESLENGIEKMENLIAMAEELKAYLIKLRNHKIE